MELTDILAPDQIEDLVYNLALVCAAGYGEVSVKIENGHPRTIVTSVSYVAHQNTPEREKARRRKVLEGLRGG